MSILGFILLIILISLLIGAFPLGRRNAGAGWGLGGIGGVLLVVLIILLVIGVV